MLDPRCDRQVPAKPKLIDLSPPGYPPQSLAIFFRARRDGRNPQYYARRTVPIRLRKTPRNPYATKALGAVSLERAKELAWQWWTTTERKILQDKPLREEQFSVIAESYLHDMQAKTLVLNEQNRPLIAQKKYARHRQSIRIHLTPFFGSMPINGIQPEDVERWLEHRLSSRLQRDESPDWVRRSQPARSTIQKDAVAFAAVVRHARLRFKVDTRFVPELPLPPKSRDTRRPRFYPEEWQRIS
jgi:integrase